MHPRGFHPLLAAALGFAALALFIPSVASAVRPDGDGGPIRVLPASYSGNSDDVFMRAVARHESAPAVRPDDRVGPLGVGAFLTEPSTPLQAVRPDDRAGTLGVGAVSTGPSTTTRAARPDDRSGPLGAQPITRTTHAAVSLPALSASDGGFQWRDAAIGAGSALVACMLALVAITLQRQHRRAVAH